MINIALSSTQYKEKQQNNTWLTTKPANKS